MLPTTICAGMESRLALPCRLPTNYVLTGYSLCTHFVQAAHRAVAVPRPPHALPACQQAHLGRTRPHTRPRALRRTARGASQPSYSPPNHIPHPLSPVTFLPNPPSLLLPFPPRWLPAHPSDLALSHPISSYLIPSRDASKVLDLGENKLGPAFPHVGSMAGLQHLHLPSNRIAELPAEQVP